MKRRLVLTPPLWLPLLAACESIDAEQVTTLGRSAAAVDALAAAGCTNVWNLTEGFEGDRDRSGARALNGWRNAGLPCTARITREQAAWTQ